MNLSRYCPPDGRHKLVFQRFTDFSEIRDEIQRETERVSGSNKVSHIMLDLCLVS